jgi:hypothetical protein
MAVPIRREITDLVAIYSMERTIREVFVEGPSDRYLIEWALRESGDRNTKVREIDVINVPSDLLIAMSFENNNRGRLLALAAEIERRLGSTMALTAIPDSDFDLILQRKHKCSLVVFTDYACMEMYFLDRATLDKFLTVILRGFPKDARRVESDVLKALQEMFLIRLADHTLGWKLDIVPFLDFCSMQDDGVEFQNKKYVVRLLIANGEASRESQFLEEIEKHRCQLSGDPRNQIHGHDFTLLLAWYTRNHGKSGINQNFVERTLPGCREFASLMEETLFSTLVGRVRS